MDRKPTKGRGAISNSSSRYRPAVSLPVDDGWGREEEPPASPGTTLLPDLASHRLVHVHISLTTLDPVLKARLEPRAASPGARLRTLEALARAEVPVGAMLAPVIPFLNDAEMEAMVAAAVSAGARSLRYILLRLPGEVRSLFREGLFDGGAGAG